LIYTCLGVYITLDFLEGNQLGRVHKFLPNTISRRLGTRPMFAFYWSWFFTKCEDSSRQEDVGLGWPRKKGGYEPS